MNMDILKSFTEQMQGFAAPLTRYNQLLASNIEQLTRLQLASANAYAELGLNQLQAVSKVQDTQSLATLGTVQLETASQENGRRVVVIADNSKYHHAKLHAAWRLERQGRFSLDFLPPYSPELNPIERVWKRTRRNCLHNAYFPRLALVAESVEKQFVRWSEPNAELAQLCQL